MEFEIDVQFEAATTSDTYSGHGHAFEPDLESLVACIEFAVPVTFRETVGEMISGILEDINSRLDPATFLTDDEDVREQVLELLTDKNIEKAIREALPEGVGDDEPFYDEPVDEEEDGDEEDFVDFYQYGYIHVYRR